MKFKDFINKKYDDIYKTDYEKSYLLLFKTLNRVRSDLLYKCADPEHMKPSQLIEMMEDRLMRLFLQKERFNAIRIFPCSSCGDKMQVILRDYKEISELPTTCDKCKEVWFCDACSEKVSSKRQEFFIYLHPKPVCQDCYTFIKIGEKKKIPSCESFNILRLNRRKDDLS
jgi:hypothetical protein